MEQKLKFAISYEVPFDEEGDTYLIVLPDLAFLLTVLSYDRIGEYLRKEFKSDLSVLAVVNVTKQGLLLGLNVADTNYTINHLRSLMIGENRFMLDF